MAAHRPLILAAIATALGQATAGAMTKPTGLTVHRARHRSVLDDQDLPAQVVYTLRNPNTDRASTTAIRELHVAVENRVKVTDTTAPDDALDSLVSWAETAIRADETLGGVALHVELQGTDDWAARQADDLYALAVTVFVVRYQHTWNDPEA